MKKVTSFLMALLLVVFSGCTSPQKTIASSNSTTVAVESIVPSTAYSSETTSPPETTVPDLFANYDISDEWIDRYEIGFVDYFSVDEYILLCDIASSISAEPYEAVSKTLFIVKQDFSTYNEINQKSLLVDVTGNILCEYEDTEESVYSIYTPWHYNVGNFSIIPAEERQKRNVYSATGEYIGTFSDIIDAPLEKIIDIGNDYYVFIPKIGAVYCLYLLTPTGECIMLDVDTHKLPTYADDCISVGTLCDGYFSVHYEYLLDVYAYYFDESGAICIDLSTEVTDWHVLELGNFAGEKATIKFTGVDNRKYTGTIDKSGQFLEEPSSN